jgi:hypothetical protein
MVAVFCGAKGGRFGFSLEVAADAFNTKKASYNTVNLLLPLTHAYTEFLEDH